MGGPRGWSAVEKVASIKSLLRGEDVNLTLYAVGREVEYVVATVEMPRPSVQLRYNGLVLGEQMSHRNCEGESCPDLELQNWPRIPTLMRWSAKMPSSLTTS